VEGPGSDGGRVLFFGCKGESHTHKQGFKQLFRRLRTMYKPEKLDALEDFRSDHLRGASILVRALALCVRVCLCVGG